MSIVKFIEERTGIFILSVIFLIVAFLFFHENLKNSLEREVIVVVLGTIFTVGAMILILRIQYEEEQKKEYRAEVFRAKLNLYTQLLDMLFKLDDDRQVTEDEIIALENKIGALSLVADKCLVRALIRFFLQLKISNCIHYTDFMENREAVENLRQFIRNNRELLKEEECPVEKKEFVTIGDIVYLMRKDIEVVKEIDNNLSFLIDCFNTIDKDKELGRKIGSSCQSL